MWLLLCLWAWGIFFGEFQCLPVDDCPAASCDSGVLTRGSESTSFYSTVLVQLSDSIFLYFKMTTIISLVTICHQRYYVIIDYIIHILHFIPVTYFATGSLYLLPSLTYFSLPPSPSHLATTCLFSVSLTLFLICSFVLFFRFHI